MRQWNADMSYMSTEHVIRTGPDLRPAPGRAVARIFQEFPPMPTPTPGTRQRPSRARFFGLALAVISPVLLAGCDGGPLQPELEGELEVFVSLMNEHRASVGCPALRWNGDVAAVALAHSQDMVDRDFFAHTNPDGDTPADRLRAAGIDYRRMAENIAMGFQSGTSVLEAWLGSQGHRTNIENCQLEEHGVGLVGGHWTHLFATL